MAIPVPAAAEELTTDLMSAMLTSRFPDCLIESVSIEQIGQDYGLASTLYRCKLSGKSMPNSLIAKLWNTDGLGGSNEVGFYEELGSKLSDSIPTCFYGALHKDQKRGILFLEDIRDAKQGDCTERATYEEAKRLALLLAEIHAANWESVKLDAWEWLEDVRPVRATGEWLNPRAEKIQQLYGELFDPLSRELLNNAVQLGERANEILANSYQTLVHGDLHLDNVLLEEPKDKIYLLDWASVMKGSPAHDLEVLLFDIGPLEKLDQLFTIYASELKELGVSLDENQLWQETEGVLLRNFIRHTCGLANWPNPSGRALQIVRTSIRRAVEAVNFWSTRNPELFEYS